MGKKRRQPTTTPAGSSGAGPSPLAGLLAGRPSVPGVLLLLGMVLVIGLSGGYLAYRFAGAPSDPAAPQAAEDRTASWRARLMQDPQDLTALLGLAHVHLDQGAVAEAEGLYRKVLGLDPQNVEAITHLGNVLLARGEADGALAQYDAALALRPDYVHALWDKGHLLQQVRRDYAGAIRTWERFIQAVGPESPDAKTAQGFIAEARKGLAESPAAPSRPRPAS